MLFIVLFESADILGKHRFAVDPKTYDTWEEADRAAQLKAALIKKRAWVAQIGKPSLIELVK
jgi:hypothetical protein